MTDKMNAEAKKLWLEALRSGKYKQGRGALARDYDGPDVAYCCLGVACEVAFQNGVVTKRMGSSNMPYLLEYDGNATKLPDSVVAWLGVDSATPVAPISGSLMFLNDAEGYTFEQIADVIEEEL